MMNLEEIREIVNFMKEVGLCELAYTEKNLSVKLKLAEQACCGSHCNCDCDCSCNCDAEEETTPTAEAVEEETASAEQEQTVDAETDIDSEVRQAVAEVKKAALRAAEVVNTRLKGGAAMIKDGAEYIKTKRDERLGNTQAETVVEDAIVTEAIDLDDDAHCPNAAPSAEPPVADAEQEAEESVTETEQTAEAAVTLDTSSAKVAVIKTAETLFNTAKAGASLGKAGLKRGKGLLTSLFPDRSAHEPTAGEQVAAEADAPVAETQEKVEETK